MFKKKCCSVHPTAIYLPIKLYACIRLCIQSCYDYIIATIITAYLLVQYYASMLIKILIVISFPNANIIY